MIDKIIDDSRQLYCNFIAYLLTSMINQTQTKETWQITTQTSAGIFERRLPRTWLVIATVLLTLMGFGIRLHELSLDSFWIDELITIEDSKGDIESILDVRDHPPLLYLLTKASIFTFGESEFTVRLPSALIGLFTIPLLIAFGRALNRPLAGILAALLIILSPFHLHHAQEARHYALLLTLSLASYLLLFLAMKKPRFSRWIGFGLATTLNLYLHYGAFVVLAVQSIIIAGWSLSMIIRRHYRSLKYPISAAFTIIALYTVQLPRLDRAFDRTFIDKGNVSFNTQADLISWLENLYPALSTQSDLLAPVLLALCLIGIAILLYRREWLSFAFCLLGLGLPLIVIIITGADRTANPRYVIHLLSFYVLLAAIALSEFLGWLNRQVGSGPALGSLATIIILILVISLPLVQDEYEFATSYMRNTAQTLNEVGQDGDIVLAMSLSLPSDDNLVGRSLSYYLDKGSKQFHLIEATRILPEDIEELNLIANERGNIWGVVSYWGGSDLAEQYLKVEAHQGTTYLIQDPSFEGSSLEKILNIYDKSLPLAETPFPHCVIEQDVAMFYQKMGQIDSASRILDSAREECPEIGSNFLNSRLSNMLNLEHMYREFEEAQSTGTDEEIRELAAAIQPYYPQDEEIQAHLKIVDLLVLFDRGQARVESEALEPVSRASFGMPPNNYEGDVLLLHPPGRVTYELTLPEDPVVLRTRIAMVPDSWEWGGDGSTFVIQLKTDDGHVTELLRQHISNEQSDHYWHPIVIPLSNYAGQRVSISLQTESGPAGNDTGDWAIWDRPGIWWETETPLGW